MRPILLGSFLCLAACGLAGSGDDRALQLAGDGDGGIHCEVPDLDFPVPDLDLPDMGGDASLPCPLPDVSLVATPDVLHWMGTNQFLSTIIQNVGTGTSGPLIVTNIAPPFELQLSACHLRTLAAGESCRITVRAPQPTDIIGSFSVTDPITTKSVTITLLRPLP